MERILYRKLTRKSQLKFGKYSELTVEGVLDCIAAGKDYLRWCYFNLSGITFFDDILDELEITPEWRFQKPGTRPEEWEAFISQLRKQKFKETYGEMSEESRKKALSIRKNKKLSHRRAKCVSKELQWRDTPGALQWKNHGHKVGDK